MITTRRARSRAPLSQRALNFFSAWLAALLIFTAHAGRAGEVKSHYFSAKPGSLEKARERLAAGDKELAQALDRLKGEAEKALNETPSSVVEKKKTPPSGDKHDYMSLAPYFWPNPETSNGLPYVRHDGKVNPESRDDSANDSVRIQAMGHQIETLALAYYFTTNEAYAAKAAKLARAWFLDPATRMNPNLNFAQAVLGVNSGRGTGILEGRHISEAADALGLLADSKNWPAANQKEFNVWLEKYFEWLTSSDAGKAEHGAKNNHGSWYDVQSARLALCLGKTNAARAIIEEAKQQRVTVQIEPDGRQPLELERTASFNYSCFNLEALCELATLGEYVNVDLWHFATADERSMEKGIQFMLPYVDKPAKTWPFEQIKDPKIEDFLPILREATLAYGNPAFEQIVAKYQDTARKRFQLVFTK